MTEKGKKAERREEEGTRAIRNRDIYLLSHVLYTIQDVSATEQLRQWQQDRLYSMTQRITGMPGGGGQPSGLDEKMATIGELEEKYAKECATYLKELEKAEEILNSIRSRTMRTFVMQKYVLGMGDTYIQNRLNMKRRKYEQARKAIEQAPDMAHVKWEEPYRLKG